MCGIFLYTSKNPIKGKQKKFLNKCFQKLKHRGPDQSEVRYYGANTMMGFHRLAIMDPTNQGIQPFESEDQRFVCMCNGEIFNFKELIQTYDLKVNSHSDCEVILPLFLKLKNIPDLCDLLDGEFAFVIYDTLEQKVFFGVDEIRVRPLFLGINDEGIYLSSEQKAITNCQNIIPVPSGSYGVIENNQYDINAYYNFENTQLVLESPHLILRDLLTENMTRKLNSEREYGFLLSGGLDSSLVCGMAAKIMHPARIHTFTVGFDKNASDIIAARKVAKHIDSIHTEFIFTYEDGINILEDVIYANESWDQTTVRASIPMSLACGAIKRKHPEMAVIFSGELSDEEFMGYLEWNNSPSAEASRNHVIKRVKDVTYFDGLRADRTVSSYGMELRLPFFSREILDFVLSLDPKLLDPKHNNGIEKYLLRKAFEGLDCIPEEILYRTKNAFSDSTSIVGKNSWKEALKSYADTKVTDSRFGAREVLYPDNTPQTKEDMLYREIFDEFEFNSKCIPYKWLPEWSEGQTDSSATELVGFYDQFNN